MGPDNLLSRLAASLGSSQTKPPEDTAVDVSFNLDPPSSYDSRNHDFQDSDIHMETQTQNQPRPHALPSSFPHPASSQTSMSIDSPVPPARERIRQSEALIAELQSTLQSRDHTISQQQSNISLRDATIQSRNDSIREQDAIILQRDSIIKQREGEVHGHLWGERNQKYQFEEMVGERDAAVHERDGLIHDHKIMVAQYHQLQQTCNDWQHRAEDLERQLRNVTTLSVPVPPAEASPPGKVFGISGGSRPPSMPPAVVSVSANDNGKQTPPAETTAPVRNGHAEPLVLSSPPPYVSVNPNRKRRHTPTPFPSGHLTIIKKPQPKAKGKRKSYKRVIWRPWRARSAFSQVTIRDAVINGPAEIFLLAPHTCLTFINSRTIEECIKVNQIVCNCGGAHTGFKRRIAARNAAKAAVAADAPDDDSDRGDGLEDTYGRDRDGDGGEDNDRDNRQYSDENSTFNDDHDLRNYDYLDFDCEDANYGASHTGHDVSDTESTRSFRDHFTSSSMCDGEGVEDEV